MPRLGLLPAATGTPGRPVTAPLHTLGMHANQLARHTTNERMQAVLLWVGVGSVIMMGLGAAAHLYRDVCKPQREWQPEPYPRHRGRELLDDLDRRDRQR